MESDVNEVVEFESGATRSTDKPFDPEGFLCPEVLYEFGLYMVRHRKQADGRLRPSDNWQKGMPISRYMQSLMRHVFEAWRIWRSRNSNPYWHYSMLDSLSAVLFNVQGSMLEVMINGGMITRPQVTTGEDDNVHK